MSAKLLYSLSDENHNLKKQIGCLNGLLQFLDPHHFISNTSINSPKHRTVPSDENKQQERTISNASKKSKEKHQNIVKEKQVNPIESSRLSISSTTSTTTSLSEYDCTTKRENSPFPKSSCNGGQQSWAYRANQPHSSPRQSSSPAKKSHYFDKKHVQETTPTCASPIKPPSSREAGISEFKHMDSPRLSYSSRPDSPRLSARNESFRSISTHHSAPIVTPRNKDLARLSYDGRETRDSYMSTSKFRDLPRLSLDSKQRTMKDVVHGSKDDLLLRDSKRENAPQEPASCRLPSNIVAKLMGLEELPDFKPSSKSQREYDGSCSSGSPDVLSRSSRTQDESKVSLLKSPRSNTKKSRGTQLNKAKSKQEEAKSEPINHPLTIYGAMEKRLADLDFQKSGKDLRALKQILESMHREKNKLEISMENQSSQCTSQQIDSSCFHITQKQGLKKATPPKVKSAKSNRETKLTKVVKDSRKEVTHLVQDLPLLGLQRLKIVQPVDGKKASIQKKTAKDLKESPHIMNKFSRERTPRLITKTSKAPESMTKASLTCSSRISDNRSSRVKQRLSQNQNLAQNLSLLQERDDQSSEFSNDSVCLSQQRNPTSLMSQEQVSDNKNQQGTQGVIAYEELTVAVREQPSPVSVLDASFYDDESPSPVKKKPTAFRDYDSNATYIEAEWKDTDPSYFSDRMKLGFSNETENFQKLESAPPIWKLSSYQYANSRKTIPIYNEVHLEKLYVSEILLASGILDDLNYQDCHLLLQSQEAINPKLFCALEHTRGSSFLSDKSGRQKRKLLFDAVNEILPQILTQPKPLLKKKSGIVTRGPWLLQAILRELDQLQPINLPHDLDDEEDFLTTIIEKDLTQRSANWTDVGREIPALVLDIERLVFKDLIVELVHDNAEVNAQKLSKH